MPRFEQRGEQPRDRIAKVRLTASEQQSLRDEAELAGLTVSDFLRRRAFGRKVTSHADLKVVNELRRLGGLFKHAHIVTGGVLSKETAAVIVDIREAIKAITVAARDR
jgi:hypothetical protein